MDLPPRTLSSSTASFARDNIALDLASQELDFGTKWTKRLLRTPSPQGPSQPPPLFHGSKNRAMRTSPIPFKGFSDSDSDSDANETDNTCQGASETGNMLCPSTHRALMYLWNGHSRG